MNNFNKVLLATDLSSAAGRLPDCLFELCPDTGTEIVLVHVLGDDDDADPHSSGYKQSQAKLKRYEEDLRKAGYEQISVMMPVGETIEQLNMLAVELDVDLAMLASHGKGYIRSTLLGSTAQNLALNTNRPLLMLPEIDDN